MQPDLKQLGAASIVVGAGSDVTTARERSRLRRIRRLTFILWVAVFWAGARLAVGNPVRFGWPSVHIAPAYAPGLLIAGMMVTVLIVPMMAAGRSPHVRFRPSAIDISLADVRGAGPVVEEVVKTLNLFLSFETFREQMGGTPRRAVLFEGPPGTGKTYVAKAMAREAGVPFLFVSSSAFQSMYFGQTNKKIRAFFKALRKAARREGGAIGFIEELDAIGASRAGMGGSAGHEGVTGVVNELLVQLQSIDTPPPGERLMGWLVDQLNRWLARDRQIAKRRSPPANILVIGATNRKDDLDPALLRPGRFDRCIYFDLPSRSGRREIINYYLDRKAHTAELDDPARRDAMAAMTFGYTPVMIEHLLDEALVWALRRGEAALGWHDIQQAKMTEEMGLKQPVEYVADERCRIATHEAGHATVAHLVGARRKLEVLSIIKRRDALGLLAHSDEEERFTQSRSDVVALIHVAMGGMAAEELYFGEAGTGASADLVAATTAAARMVGSFGMAGSLVSFEAVQSAVGSNIVAKVLADDAGRAAVERILNDAKAAVGDLLSSHRVLVEALRDALLEREELLADDITEVIERASRSVEIDLRDTADEPLGVSG